LEVASLGLKNTFLFKLVISLFVAGSFSALFAGSTIPVCLSDTVANYVTTTANPPATGGCAIGILDYYNLTYHPITNAPLASNINVAPLGAGFTFGPVSAAPGQTVSFEIDYDIFIDPAPIITGDSLGLDVTGNITVTEFFCNDSQYIGSGLCLGSHPAQSLTVGNGNGLPNSATIAFAQPATTSQQVGIVFTLVGGTGGASFDGLNAASIVTGIPEPSSFGSALIGLLALAGGYKLRKRHNRSV
jgi:hypothetical protein